MLVLSPAAAAVGRARTFVHQRCRTAAVDEDTCDTAVLLTSETVTNAFMHGRSEARLAVTADPRRVLVEVGDDNSRLPHLAEQDRDALDGRGMAIVSMLAEAWGVRTDPLGKVVWFEVAPDGAPE